MMQMILLSMSEDDKKPQMISEEIKRFSICDADGTIYIGGAMHPIEAIAEIAKIALRTASIAYDIDKGDDEFEMRATASFIMSAANAVMHAANDEYGIFPGIYEKMRELMEEMAEQEGAELVTGDELLGMHLMKKLESYESKDK